jgi:hypothetical protein
MIKSQTENMFYNKGIKVGKSMSGAKTNYKRILTIPIHSLTKKQKEQQTNKSEKSTQSKVKDLVNKFEKKTKI